MHIIIIGSKGFIGSNCKQYFEKKNHTVYSCDVVTDYVIQRYFQIDATNSDYRTVFENHNFDICINCSGAADVSASLKEPLRDYTLNTLNVYKLLDSIRKFQPNCKFINLSSAAVYGNPQYLPINELHTLNPISPYGFHKLDAERICQEFSQFWGIKTCSLRIFSAYGPGLYKQLFWELAQKAKGNKHVELFGTGNESRDFIYIDDLVKAIDIIINTKTTDWIYNISSGTETLIKDAVSEFYNLFDASIKFSFKGIERSGDPINWCADVNKIKQLGFEPKFNLKTGLKNYIEWLEGK